MSEPQHAQRGGNGGPRPDHALDEEPAGDCDGPSQAPDNDHPVGRRRALHVATDPIPAPEPEKPTAAGTARRPVRQLTWDEITYFVESDLGKFLDEDFYRDLEFDRAIDLEPELE